MAVADFRFDGLQAVALARPGNAESILDPEFGAVGGTLDQGAVFGQKPPWFEIQRHAGMGAGVDIDEDLMTTADNHVEEPAVRCLGEKTAGSAVRDVVHSAQG